MAKSDVKIDYSKTFTKQLKKAPLKIKIAFRKRLELFIKEPLHPLLRNHPLTGRLSGYRSINVTGDWRALYREMEDENNKIVIFVILGTHNQLYR